MATPPRMAHLIAGGSILVLGSGAWAQGLGFESGDGKTRVIVHEVDADPMDPASIERRQWLAGVEQKLRKLNSEYFRGIRNVQIRQVGISKLREFDDPGVWPTMLDVFKRSDNDVHSAILDMFYDAANDEGDATLAWIATFEKNEAMRTGAADRLESRLKAAEKPSDRIESVIAYALKSDDNKTLENAANLANKLGIIEAIPGLINAQIQGTTVASDRGTGGEYLAYILVGQQISFVSDLTPVVGDSAVAFDPTVAVATDGVVLAVGDAVVTTYRLEVHNALVGLSSAAWGQSTQGLGWDQKAWQDWYTDEFVPYLAAKKEAELASTDAGDEGPG